MTATTVPSWTVTTDAWTLRAMRDAAAFRAANPDPEHAAADAYLDAYLAACEEAVAALGMTEERPVADEAPRPRSSGNGSSNYAAAVSGATPPQQRFIRSMAATLGYDEDAAQLVIDNCRTWRDASKAIDRLKAEVAKARAAGTAAPRPARKATDRQVEYVTDLLLERAHNHPSDLDVDALSFDQASALITELRDAPRAKVAAHGIREGRYAYSTDGGKTADHYRVSRTGKITVWTAGGEYPYTGKGLTEPLAWIKENQREAAALFGQLVGSCGRCGRDLSNDESREIGLGPVCATKTW